MDIFRRVADEEKTSVKNVSSIWDDMSFGFKSGIASILQATKNLTVPVDKVADLYSKRMGIPRKDALKDVSDLLDALQREYGPTAEDLSKERGIGGRIISGVARMPMDAAKYAPILALTRNPTLTFALVDGISEAHRGPMEAGKAAAMGAATGYMFGKLPRVASLGKRALAGATIGGAGAAIGGGKIEDVAAGAALGGAMGVITPGEKLIKNQVPIIERPADVTPVLSKFQSMHELVESQKIPGAPPLVLEGVIREREASHLAYGWKTRAEQAFSPLNKSERRELIHYLDDEKYTMENLPPASPPIRDAFAAIRPLTDDVRSRIIDAKRQELVNGGMSRKDAEKTFIDPDTGESIWGKKEGYFPRTWEGPWRIMYFAGVDKEGKPSYKLIPTMAGAETRRQAQIQADQFLSIPGNTIQKGQVFIVQTEPKVPPKYAAEKGKRFWGHAQERAQGAGGWLDTPEALYRYLEEASRYVTVAPMRPKWQKVSKWLEDNRPRSEIRNMWDGYVGRMEGRPDPLTKTINEWWIQQGGKPNVVQDSLGAIRGMEAVLKIGTSPVSIFMNLTQLPLNCVDEETEALTKSGWKKHSSLGIGEDILCYDISTDTCRWGPIKGMFASEYNGELFALESRQISARTTVGHRWPVQNRLTQKRHEVTNQLALPRGGGSGEKGNKFLRGLHNIPLTRMVDNLPADSQYNDSFVSLCGWIAAEGHFTRDSRKGRKTRGRLRAITLGQSPKVNGRHVDSIRKLLGDEGIAGKEYTDPRSGVIRWNIPASYARRVFAVLPNKAPSAEFISSLPLRQLRILMDALIDGDGNRRKGLNHIRFSNTNPDLVDAFQMIATLLGRTASAAPPRYNGPQSTKPIQSVTLKTGRFSEFAQVRHAAHPPVQYSGVVWCPQVDTTFWVARRRGSVYCTGNTVPVLGSKWAWKGFTMFMERAKHPEWNKILDDLYIRDAVSKLDEQTIHQRMRVGFPEGAGGVPKWALEQAQYWTLLGFTKAEYLNRSVTALGAYAKAREKLGLSHEAAMRKALETEIRTQFVYTTSDAPAILSNPWMRTAFQFKNFWVKQLEYMYGLGRKDNPLRFSDTTRAQEMMRFLTNSLLLTGAVGVPFIETVDSMIEHITRTKDDKAGVSILDETLKVFPNASRGLPGMIGTFTGGKIPGLDLSKNVGYGDYFSLRNLMNPFGPFVQEFVALTKWFFAEDGADKDALAKRLQNVSPQARRLWESYTAWADGRGEVRDTKNRVRVTNVSNVEQFLAASGFTPNRMADERRQMIHRTEEAERLRDRSEKYASDMANALEKQDMEKFRGVAQEAIRLGLTPSIRTSVSKLTNRKAMSRVASVMWRNRRAMAQYLRDNPEAWNEWVAGLREALAASQAAEPEPVPQRTEIPPILEGPEGEPE